MAIKPFADSLREYEAWLRAQLEDDLWEDDLEEKHEKMRDSPFVFLRATYWRWAEAILTIRPDLADAPLVFGVGDIHLENYGVWRDGEGRLVWGVNDFDEAAEMPYVVDVVRLATSAVLSLRGQRRGSKQLCADVLDGYRQGLAKPRPFSLDEKHLWLRNLFEVTEDERGKFWKKMNKLDADDSIPARYRAAIERQMPGNDAVIEKFARRHGAGTGSLGRPRWVGVAKWRGGRLVREAKAIVPSGWTLAHPSASRRRSAAPIVGGRYRAPDPWYLVQGSTVVRRLSPNSRKIEVQDHPQQLVDDDMLQAMGHELANVHLGTANVGARIETDLEKRGGRWLERSTAIAAEFVAKEFKQFAR
jgi:hypothetical protein